MLYWLKENANIIAIIAFWNGGGFIEPIITRAGTRDVVTRYGLRTRKQLGQHFLVDPHVLEKITRASDIGADDCILEIGPGIGAVTQALLQQAGRVCAVELDTALIPVLQDMFGGYENFTLHHGDILKLDIGALLSPFAGMCLKVVANLPYYVTTPVIMRLLEKEPHFSSITVMVQREVAERMTARPSTKAYGALTLAVAYYAEVSIAAYVPPNSFMPRPNVDSAVVHMLIRNEPPTVANKDLLFQVIHAAFNQRRKTLVNALTAKNAPFAGESGTAAKEVVLSALTRCGLAADTRGETLSMEDFSRLTEALSEGSEV